MTQEEKWQAKYDEVKAFIEKNKLNPSRYDAEERGLYVNWLRHNRKMDNSVEMKEERLARFKELLSLTITSYMSKLRSTSVPENF